MRAYNAAVTEDTLSEQISKLSQKQQERVRQCFAAAAAKKKSFRCSKLWIVEYIIMKMKSSRLYDHIRDNEILALPSKSTLKQYKSAFGFSKKVSEEFKNKMQDMDPFKKHGGLLVDDLKLSEHYL